MGLGFEKMIYIVYIEKKKCRGSFGKTCGTHSMPRIPKQLINVMG